MTALSRGRGGCSKIGGLRYNPPHQTNKGSHHAQDPRGGGHLPPRRAVHPQHPRPKTTRGRNPLYPEALILTLALLQVAQQASYRQLLFGLAPQLLTHHALPPWAPCSIASRPCPKPAGTSGSLGWRRKGLPWNRLPSRWRSRWCWWTARAGGSIRPIMRRTVGGGDTADALAWKRGHMGLLAG
jgi:hypothetical protein